MGFWARMPAGLVILARDGRPLLRVGVVARSSGTDELTGLAGRDAFLAAAERELARIRRGGLPGCVAVLDLDGLKAINDRFGHEVGDRIILQVAQVVAGSCRAADLVARGAGDELWLLLPATEIEDTVITLERLSARLTEQVHLPDGVGVTVSTGLARLDRAGHHVSAVVEHAVTAAHAAKARMPGHRGQQGPVHSPAVRVGRTEPRRRHRRANWSGQLEGIRA